MDKKQFTTLLLSTIIAVFLSIFFSFWFFTANFHHPLGCPCGMMPPPPAFNTNNSSFKQISKMMEEQQKAMDEMADEVEHQREHGPNPFFVNNMKLKPKDSVSIESQELGDIYKVTINLKPFGNDAKNIDLKVEGNVVKITAKYDSKDKKLSRSSEIYQSFTLPSKIDEKAIKKTQLGDLLVITIPKVEKKK
jgi:HSP20 family molecular chaperone IbpA